MSTTVDAFYLVTYIGYPSSRVGNLGSSCNFYKTAFFSLSFSPPWKHVYP